MSDSPTAHADGASPGPRRDPRTVIKALVLLALGVLVGIQLSRYPFWWPEALIIVVVVALVAGAQKPREPVEWRPWRHPHPVRGTVALGLDTAALVWFFVTDLSREAVRFEVRVAVAFTLVLAGHLIHPGDGKRRGGPWIFRVFFIGFVIYWWWETYRALTR
jgi:hypothetical protein